MKTIVTTMKHVAETDQLVSIAARTGRKNNIVRMIRSGLIAITIVDPGTSSCTTPRWIRRFQRKIARPEERGRVRTAQHPVIRRGVWW